MQISSTPTVTSRLRFQSYSEAPIRNGRPQARQMPWLGIKWQLKHSLINDHPKPTPFPRKDLIEWYDWLSMLQKTFAGALIVAFTAAAQVPLPSDVVTVGTVSGAAGTNVDVPVYIRDVSGTPLGLDQPPGSRIQSYAVTVNYAPAASVSAVTFTRSGITATLTPAFESDSTSVGSISLLDTFQEFTNIIPFLVNAPAPGNQVAMLHVTLSPSAPAGSVTLTLNPALTQLANQGGTTTETTANSNLVLVNGSVTVAAAPQSVPAVSSMALLLLVLLLGGGGWVLQQPKGGRAANGPYAGD